MNVKNNEIEKLFKQWRNSWQVRNTPTLYDAYEQGYKAALAKVDEAQEEAFEYRYAYEQTIEKLQSIDKWNKFYENQPPSNQVILLLWHERTEGFDYDNGSRASISADFARVDDGGYIQILRNVANESSDCYLQLEDDACYHVDRPLYWLPVPTMQIKPKLKAPAISQATQQNIPKLAVTKQSSLRAPSLSLLHKKK
jgi:hypothetical protein